MKLQFATLLTVGLLTGLAFAAEPQKPISSGITQENNDPSVRPQDDFFNFMHGNWLKKTPIPADQSSWGAFEILADDTLKQLRELIQSIDPNQATDPDAKKIGDFYASFMNEAKLEELAALPLQADLARIAALKTIQNLPELCAHMDRLGVVYPFGVSIEQDARDSSRYAVNIMQDGLGMPDRAYYLKTNDPKLAAIRSAYLKHIETMLGLVGDKDAASHAKNILLLETAIAKIQRSRVENRNPEKLYNKYDLKKLATLTPNWNWDSYLTATGIKGKIDYVIVSQPEYVKAMDAVFQKTPLDTWKAYLQWQLVRTYAEFLSAKFVAANFNFYSKTIEGIPENQPRWTRGVEITQAALGESIGKIYVAKYFPPERKQRLEKLVQNLLSAYKKSVATLDWMSDATKREAQDKLAKFLPKIGYPDQWLDYSDLQVVNDALVNNVMRGREFAYNRQLAKLGQPVKREEWDTTPQTVNAFYNASRNEIVFPAAFLQAPFFNADADDAVNYGAIGVVIGHEISHGFDDEGSRFDGDGNLRDWWSKQDHINFAAKTKMLIRQYNAFSPIKGYYVNGALTLGENIADNSGMAIAYKAYQASLGGKPAPVIDGLSGDQRFFMGYAQVWRSKSRVEITIARLKTDPHSPDKFRTNGVLRNSREFYQAFGVKKGDKMYLAPKDRVTIW